MHAVQPVTCPSCRPGGGAPRPNDIVLLSAAVPMPEPVPHAAAGAGSAEEARVTPRSAARTAQERCLLDRVMLWAWEEPPSRAQRWGSLVPTPIVWAALALTALVLAASWATGWLTFGLILVGAVWLRLGFDTVLTPDVAQSLVGRLRRLREG